MVRLVDSGRGQAVPALHVESLGRLSGDWNDTSRRPGDVVTEAGAACAEDPARR
jgi:hypothetical protein